MWRCRFISRKLNRNLKIMFRIRNRKKSRHQNQSIENRAYRIEKPGVQNDSRIYFPRVHLLTQLQSSKHLNHRSMKSLRMPFHPPRNLKLTQIALVFIGFTKAGNPHLHPMTISGSIALPMDLILPRIPHQTLNRHGPLPLGRILHNLTTLNQQALTRPTSPSRTCLFSA